GLPHPIAEIAQLAHHGGANVGIVLDRQDHLLAGRACSARPERCGGRARLAPERQEELEHRAVAELAVGTNVAAGLLEESIHHAETEPGSLPDRLGREERLENPLDELRR